MIKRLTKIVLVFIISVNLIYFNSNINIVLADEEDDQQEELLDSEIEELTVETVGKVTDEPSLNAKACVVFDRTTKEIIYGQNEYTKKAMASTTKIMTAIVVLENCNLKDEVIISKKAAGIGGSSLKIKAEDKISVNDLLYGIMLRSGNDAAVALAEHTAGSVNEFATLMNKKAEELGLKNTHFVTPHGLDNDEHYTTAYELALLTDYALDNEIFRKIVNTKIATISINGVERQITNTNELLGNLDGVDGVKTGFTGNAGRCLVTSTTRNGNQIITVVLGCDTKKQRTQDSIKLIEYAFNNYGIFNLEEEIKKEFENWKQINKNRIYINKAKDQELNLELGEITKKQIPIKKGENDKISYEINVIYNFEAPVEKDVKIGNIVVKRDNDIIDVIDIKVASTVKKKNVVSYFIQLLTFYNNFGIINMLT